jgi:hypothetical protein
MELKYNQLQELSKLLMNSTFGKLGWDSVHSVTNKFESNDKKLAHLFMTGQLKSFK